MKGRLKNHRIKLMASSKPGVRVDNRTSWWWKSFSSADWRTALTASHLKSFFCFPQKTQISYKGVLTTNLTSGADSKFFQLACCFGSFHTACHTMWQIDMKTATWFCGEAGIMEIQLLSAHFQVLTSLKRFPSPQCFLTSLKKSIVRHQKWVNPDRIFCFGKAFFCQYPVSYNVNVFSRVWKI